MSKNYIKQYKINKEQLYIVSASKEKKEIVVHRPEASKKKGRNQGRYKIAWKLQHYRRKRVNLPCKIEITQKKEEKNAKKK
jgi:hypothetical protein